VVVDVGVHGVARARGDGLGLLGDGCAHLVGEQLLRHEVLLEALERVAAFPLGDVGGVAVPGGVVGVRVRLDAVGDAFDDGGAPAGAGPLEGVGDDRVHGGGVVAVDVVPGDAVPDGAVGEGAGAGLLRQRNGD